MVRNKMSKSLDNSIFVIDKPDIMFKKIMSIPDFTMPVYYSLLTDIDYNKLCGKNTVLNNKKLLAFDIVSQLYDIIIAGDEWKNFDNLNCNNKILYY